MSESGRVVARARAIRREDDPRRSEVLDRLLVLFVAEGFAALTVDEMCRRLRCSKSTLYLVAGSREQIIRTVVRHFYTRTFAAVEAAVQSEPDLAQRLARYLTAVGEAVEGASIRFYVDLAGYEPAAEVYQEGQRTGAIYLERLIVDAVEAGALRAVDAKLVAQVVANLIAGAEVGDIGADSELTPAQALGELGDLLLRGLES